ncbi:hypothetical protein UF64_00960 [Thalassospira sp. HJ]|uniref:DUF5615 family PIN-like protein n=1 Tax=Thalassospira sp. HJ TaxID=1616823 RepID=UPI0005CF1355|nr:DUF5615 family PIN-like protein [Thalassospira sp. HJ]KJE36953.1 hypothetical protein UF64_00960 [Thalassospira sp. HJ]
MSFIFLIDECLSPDLAHMAINAGHVESIHVNWRGMQGWKDWQLMDAIIENDWTLVTHNSVDFRGKLNVKGARGLYRQQAVHAGLICLNAPGGMSYVLQKRMFKLVLQELQSHADLINQCLEFSYDADQGDVDVIQYPLP